MGTVESSQSPELAGIGGFNDQSAFRHQSPNVARLIHSENSQKMEYEFPISNENHSTTVNASYSRSDPIDQRYILDSMRQRSNPSEKPSSSESSNLWLSFSHCFRCCTQPTTTTTDLNPLNDKVHAIRIVRASNDLTPAVFDSHYNIITLEQLRECESNESDLVDSSSLPYDEQQMIDRENGSIHSSSSTKKKNSNRRLKRKKKKRPNHPSDDDDDDDEQDLQRT